MQKNLLYTVHPSLPHTLPHKSQAAKGEKTWEASICLVLLGVFFKMQTVRLTGPTPGLAKIWTVLSPPLPHLPPSSTQRKAKVKPLEGW
jgi:hypothetical protein